MAKFVQHGASGQSITFSLNGDAADIMWTPAGFGGTFSSAVDGGAATNVSTNRTGTVDGKLTHVSRIVGTAHAGAVLDIGQIKHRRRHRVRQRLFTRDSGP